MPPDYEEALDYSSRWLDLIQKNEFPTKEEAYKIIDESKSNFAEHYNRGMGRIGRGVQGCAWS
jgi:hypothetical protein